MKKLLIFITFLIVGRDSTAQIQGIQFESGLSWAQIKEKAKKERKAIFVDCYATWCAPCKVMDNQVYKSPSLGTFMNEKFISVKVQMDETEKDDVYTKSWRQSAKLLQKENQVNVFPTFLFFSPDGEIVQTGIGMKSEKDFMEMADVAVDPSKQFNAMYASYKAGKMALKQYPSFSDQARQFKREDLRNEVILAYKKRYLNRLNEKELLKDENIGFFVWRVEYFTTNDKYFSLCYRKPALFDSVTKKGKAASLVESIIQQQDVDPVIKKDDAFIVEEPDWIFIQTKLRKKYNESVVDAVLLNSKRDYYRGRGNWLQYCLLTDKKMEAEGVVSGDDLLGKMADINDEAWMVFGRSDDKEALKIALKWSERTVNEGMDLSIYSAFLDTKANLLYKLGRKEEALACQKLAIQAQEKRLNRTLTPDDDLIKTYNRMLRGM